MIETRLDEEAWMLVGYRIGPIIIGWKEEAILHGQSPSHVTFNVDESQHQRGLLGWIHTHPTFPAIMSGTDHETLRAWCFSTGKPLICAIKGTDGFRAFVLDDEDSDVRQIRCWMFDGGHFIGIDRAYRRATRRRANPKVKSAAGSDLH